MQRSAFSFLSPLILQLLCACFLFGGYAHAEKIKVATGEYPPWTSASLPNGGFINHLISRAFKITGIDVEFEYLPWKRAWEATRVGQFNASSFWAEDKERDKEFYYSEQILGDSFVFFYRKDRAPFKWKELTDLQEFKLGATLGYTYTDTFWNLAHSSKLRVSVQNDDLTNLTRLVQGEIDAFPISQLTGEFLLNKNFSQTDKEKLDINLTQLNSNMDYILFTRNIPGNDRYLKLFNLGLKKLDQAAELEKYKKELLQ